MKWHQVMMGLALMVGGGAAWSIQVPPIDTPRDPSEWQARAAAAGALRSLPRNIGPEVVLACNQCKSGFAIKVVAQVLQKPSAVPADQLAEGERLRGQAQALYDQEKYAESLEVSRKAQAILGVDAGGDPLPRPGSPGRAQ